MDSYSYIESDPCHGCKWAIELSETELNNLFSRRFGCTNKNRVAHYFDEVKWRFNDGRVSFLKESRKLLDTVIEMIDDFEHHGHCKCVESIVPNCYEKVTDNDNK